MRNFALSMFALSVRLIKIYWIKHKTALIEVGQQLIYWKFSFFSSVLVNTSREEFSDVACLVWTDRLSRAKTFWFVFQQSFQQSSRWMLMNVLWTIINWLSCDRAESFWQDDILLVFSSWSNSCSSGSHRHFRLFSHDQKNIWFHTQRRHTSSSVSNWDKHLLKLRHTTHNLMKQTTSHEGTKQHNNKEEEPWTGSVSFCFPLRL